MLPDFYEINIPPDRKTQELQRMQMYGINQENLTSVRAWLVASLTCDQICADQADLNSSPDKIIDSLNPVIPSNTKSLFDYLNQSGASLVPKVSLNTEFQQTLYFSWLKHFFIDTAKIVRLPLENSQFSSIFYMDNADLLGFTFPKGDTHQELKLHPAWITKIVDLKDYGTPFQFEDLSFTGELSLADELFTAISINKHTKPPLRQITLRHVADPQANFTIKTINADPSSFILTHFEQTNSILYPYFTYQIDGETFLAPGYTGSESMTPPDQLTHTLADFYLTEN